MADDIRPLPRERRPRKRPRKPNPEVLRRLLEAAEALINRQGVPELRVEEVAERAGLSVGTFYLYFEGKADLFAQLVIGSTERLRKRLQAVYAQATPIPERVSRAVDAYLDFVEEHEKGFLYFRDAGTVHTTVGRLSTWALAQHAQDLRPLLEEGMARGDIRRGDPELLAQAVLGLMQHLAGYWLENRDRHRREEVKRFLVELGVAGLRGEGAGRG